MGGSEVEDRPVGGVEEEAFEEDGALAGSEVPIANGKEVDPGREKQKVKTGPDVGTLIGTTGQELASQQIQIEQKRIYLDLGRNVRGVFLKIAESEITGIRSKVIIPGVGLQRFREVLDQFCDILKGLSETSGDIPAPAVGELPKVLGKETMNVERKRFFFDLLSNAKGSYLKLSQKFQDKKTNVLIPAVGLNEFRDGVQQVLMEGGCLSKTEPGQQAEKEASIDIGDAYGLEPRELRMDKKRFFFDVGCNPRGTFLCISEVANGTRTRINIPDSCWKEFRDILDTYIDKVEQTKLAK